MRRVRSYRWPRLIWPLSVLAILTSACGPKLAGPAQPMQELPSGRMVPIALKAGVKASDGQLIVGLRPGHSITELPKLGGEEPTVLGELNFATPLELLRIPDTISVEDAIAQLKDHPAVSLIAPNRALKHAPAATTTSYVSTALTRSLMGAPRPNDPYYTSEWAFGDGVTNARLLWQRAVDASGVTVAVIDTGVDFDHPELKGRVLSGYNFMDGNNDIMDHDGHGTHVAGILAAAGNNGQGIAGVSWTVKILAVKVMDSAGGSDFGASAGIQYAVDAGAKVLNLSFSSDNSQRNPTFDLAVQYALDHGVLVVAAAGNNHSGVSTPGNCPGALTVSATANRGIESLASFSNFGPEVFIAAPGDNIISTIPGGGYKTMSGTSMAAPIVSGAAAVLYAEHPGWSIDQVKDALAKSIDPIGQKGRSDKFGYGRIDLGMLP